MARHLSSLAVPLKVLVGRMKIGLLVAASVMLLVVGKVDLKLIDTLSNHADDIAVPALRLIAIPMGAARDAARQLGEMLALQEENLRLQAQVDRLLAWQAEATRLDVENQALRKIAGMPPAEHATKITTAAMVADTGGSFVHARLIDAGSARGVEVGQAVVDEKGLVGRIVSVGIGSARVLLITDLNAKIPVLVERSGDRAIMEGSSDLLPRLRFLPRDPHFSLGDRVITSGDGGLIPAGLAVGTITRTDGRRVEITPYVDWDRVDFVRILQAPVLQVPEASLPGLPVPALSMNAYLSDPTRIAADAEADR